ncbi:protein of unknown function [Thauera humireducens]|nr:protein of unknown function [Thauera humireducens]
MFGEFAGRKWLRAYNICLVFCLLQNLSRLGWVTVEHDMEFRIGYQEGSAGGHRRRAEPWWTRNGLRARHPLAGGGTRA